MLAWLDLGGFRYAVEGVLLAWLVYTSRWSSEGMEVDFGRLSYLVSIGSEAEELLQTSAYNCWKARFDTAVTSAPTAIGTQLLRNSLPLYAIAHCTLAIDVDELQIFAGKRRSLGLPVARLGKLSGATISG